MGVSEPARRLYRDIKDPKADPPFRPHVERAVTDPVFETAVLHPLRKDRRDTADLTHVIARDNIRVQAEIDPVLAFCDELRFPTVAPLGKEPRLRAFHRQLHIPAPVMDAPDTSHAPVHSFARHDICIQNRNAFSDLLIRDALRGGAFREGCPTMFPVPPSLRIFQSRSGNRHFLRSIQFA